VGVEGEMGDDALVGRERHLLAKDVGDAVAHQNEGIGVKASAVVREAGEGLEWDIQRLGRRRARVLAPGDRPAWRQPEKGAQSGKRLARERSGEERGGG